VRGWHHTVCTIVGGTSHVGQKPDANFIWSIANLLRGPYKPKEYGDVVLPMTILRRLDCVLTPTKEAVHKEWLLARDRTTKDLLEVKLRKRSGYSFYNTSQYTLVSLTGDSANVKANLLSYIDGFSDNVRDVFTRFGFEEQIQRLDEANALYLILQKFAAIDLSPVHVSNTEMGAVFEELIRKFAEASNETAGEHFTPREVIALMVDLLLVGDEDATSMANIIRTVYDPAAGTGGMLSVMDEHLRKQNPTASLKMAGQEVNPSSYAVCKADMVIKGQAVDAIALGNTLTEDAHAGSSYHYCLSNPPFGVEWKTSERGVRREHTQMGFQGRFGPGLPAVSDGSMLFLLHLVSKMRDVDPEHEETRGRAAIVLNGSPLFTGKAGSGESEIRRWVIESDLLDAIIALPTDMFYNTGIATYIWVLDRKKPAEWRGKVQLIDGSKMFVKMRKSLGSKRKELSADDVAALVKLYGAFEDGGDKRSKVFANEAFGYHTITVERPLRMSFQVTPERINAAITATPVAKLSEDTRTQLRQALQTMNDATVWLNRAEFNTALGKALGDADVRVGLPVRKALLTALGERDDNAEPCRGAKGITEPDPKLRDTENVPLGEDHRGLFRPRGSAARARRMDRPQQDEDRLRDPVHTALLRVCSAAAARGDRRRREAVDFRDSGLICRAGLAMKTQRSTATRSLRRLPVKRVCTLQSGEGITVESIEEEGPVAVYGGNGIRGYTTRGTHTGVYPLIGRQGALCGNVHLARGRFWASEHAVVATPRAGVDPRWLAYALQNMDLGRFSMTAAQPGLAVDFIKDLPLDVATTSAQPTIANFLDRETEKIDALIAKQEQLVSTLGERISAVIEDLTLGPPVADAPRPSVGQRFAVTLGKMLDAGKIRRSEYKVLPYIRAANIQDAGLDLQSVNEMPFSDNERRRLSLLRDDLLVVEGGAVGTCVVLNADMPGWSFQKTVNRVRARGSDSTQYLAYVLRALRANGEIDMICNKSTIPHLTAEKLSALRIALPDESRQKATVARLDHQTAQVDALVAKARKLIEVMKERRSALVSAAVTGQLDVDSYAG